MRVEKTVSCTISGRWEIFYNLQVIWQSICAQQRERKKLFQFLLLKCYFLYLLHVVTFEENEGKIKGWWWVLLNIPSISLQCTHSREREKWWWRVKAGCGYFKEAHCKVYYLTNWRMIFLFLLLMLLLQGNSIYLCSKKQQGKVKRHDVDGTNFLKFKSLNCWDEIFFAS